MARERRSDPHPTQQTRLPVPGPSKPVRHRFRDFALI